MKAKTFTRLFYRHWSSYTRFKRSLLFVVAPEGGIPVDITPGDHDVPPFNLGGQDMYAISPDGQELAYTSNIESEAGLAFIEATSTNNEIFVVPISVESAVSSGKIRQSGSDPDALKTAHATAP